MFTRRSILQSGLALTATTLAARASAGESFLFPVADDLSPSNRALAPRERLLMDFGWKFCFGHGTDPGRDLNFGMGQADFAKSGNHEFSKAAYDDARWRNLDLPHDWAVELPFVRDESLKDHGFKPLGRKYPDTSVGWYRKTFDVASAELGRRITVDFDGAFRSALVFVNGYFIGRNDNGYAPFSFDISDYLLYGQKNAIAVRMDASFGDGWFYEGAGIYRHVWMTKTDPVHLAPWESVVQTEVQGSAAAIRFSTVVRNHGAAATNARVLLRVVDAAGAVVLTSIATAPQNIDADGERSFTVSAKLPNVKIWSPETPNLYTALVTVECGGKTVDGESISFGARTLRWDADKGFFLNGQPTKIKGTCNHQDHAGVGAALPDRLQYFRMGVLKAMGGNAVRTSHNMPTPEWVEACDRLGMMMMCETRNDASTPEGLAQMEVMIKRYRNSPCVILWSVGNEEWELQKGDIGLHVGRAMVARAHELDPTRRVTAAINGAFDTGTSEALDVEGFNYNLWAPDPYHKKHPGKPLFGSETASTISTRGVYTTDKLRNWVSAYDVNVPDWAENAETWWKFYAEREYMAGGFAWTGFDYRGEPTPYSWPSINSAFGIVDMCGFPKDNFFYYKAWWGAEPVLHLFPHWDWQERIGENVQVWVHTNLDAVELFLNGRSLGTKKVVARTHVEWNVPYEPGAIEARGSKDGKVLLIEKRETTGKISSLRLTPDRSIIDANGEDLVLFKVEALDDSGRPVPTANFPVKFKISGEGHLLGVGNGDPNCQEPDKEPQRSLFMGLAQVILQASRTPGSLTLEAYTEDFPGPKLPAVKATVATQRASIRPAL